MAGDFFPVRDDESAERVKMTIYVPRAVAEDIELFATKLWPALDKALGIRRAFKWMSGRVVAHLLETSVTKTWEQLGGRPETKAERESFVDRAVEHLRNRKQ